LHGVAEGNLCIADSWPGQMRTVFGDHERFKQTYFSTFPGLYALLAGNPMGTFDATLNDIIACGRRAHYQLDEQAEPVSDVHEVVG